MYFIEDSDPHEFLHYLVYYCKCGANKNDSFSDCERNHLSCLCQNRDPNTIALKMQLFVE